MMMKYTHHLSSIPARETESQWKLLYGRRALNCVLCDNLEEWDEAEVQERGAVLVLRADAHYRIAGANEYRKAIIFQLK